jgi:DNA-binding NarL/FixJ family response regulator
VNSILIIEDHPVMRGALTVFFEQSGRWELWGAAASIAQAQEILQRRGTDNLDIILADIQLDGGWGLDIIKSLPRKKAGARPFVVVYSMFDDYAHVQAAISLGAAGYVSKSRSEAELETALETVLREGTYLETALAQRLDLFTDTLSLLTKRESEVLSAVKEGLSNNEIAARLGISRRRVENVLSCIYDKTGIRSRLALQKM